MKPNTSITVKQVIGPSEADPYAYRVLTTTNTLVHYLDEHLSKTQLQDLINRGYLVKVIVKTTA